MHCTVLFGKRDLQGEMLGVEKEKDTITSTSVSWREVKGMAWVGERGKGMPTIRKLTGKAKTPGIRTRIRKLV